MKKKILLASSIAIMAIPAFGQLTIAKNGMSVFGKPGSNVTIAKEQASQNVTVNPPAIPWTVAADSTATAVFLGKETLHNGGGHISFGAYKSVFLGELPSTSTSSRSGRMQLFGANGFYGQCSGGCLFAYYKGNPSDAITTSVFHFFTDVTANSFIVTSDSRLKSNVESLEGSEDMLSRISPVSYSLASASLASKASVASVESETAGTGEVAPLAPDPRTRFGFIAQEVKEVFPELVVEDEEGVLGIDYIGFIPVLVDAVKNLRAKVETQQEEIAALRMQNGAQRKAAPVAGAESGLGILSTESMVYQNRPNPFSDTTLIPYDVPEGVAQADIYIYTLQGQQMMHIVVDGRGSGNVSVDASALSPGMYIYTLMVDGIEAGSKRMIITE